MESANHREGGVCWVDLPEDVLFLVADSLSRKKDLIRFGAVCQSWQSVYMDVKHNRSPKLPVLMLSTEHNPNDQTRSLYSLTEKRVCSSKISVPHNRHCPGSSHGWPVTVSPDSQVRLLNLFPSSSCLNINEEIHLPPMTTFKHINLLRKVVLSANPALEPDYLVLAIYDAHSVLAFFKPGDKSWTSLDSPDLWDITDLIFYRDHFYGVTKRGEVFTCDLSCPKPKVVKVAPRVEQLRNCDKRYLVESPSGDLLQVIRYTEWDEDEDSYNYYNDGFFLLKLDPVEHKWIELCNIDGLVLFLGDNLSLCLPASDFPQCKQNSVYYTDDYYEGYIPFNEGEGVDEELGPHDMGVFSFDDGTTTPHYPTKSNIIYPPPIWIEPPCRTNVAAA